MPKKKENLNKDKKPQLEKKEQSNTNKNYIKEEEEEKNNKQEEEEKEEEEEDDEEIEEGEEIEDVNGEDVGYEAENDDNELSDEIFNLKEEDIKSNQKISIAYDTNNNNNDKNNDIEKIPLDKSLKLYNNNINIMKPKSLGNTKTLLFIKNIPILILAESGN